MIDCSIKRVLTINNKDNSNELTIQTCVTPKGTTIKMFIPNYDVQVDIPPIPNEPTSQYLTEPQKASYIYATRLTKYSALINGEQFYYYPKTGNLVDLHGNTVKTDSTFDRFSQLYLDYSEYLYSEKALTHLSKQYNATLTRCVSLSDSSTSIVHTQESTSNKMTTKKVTNIEDVNSRLTCDISKTASCNGNDRYRVTLFAKTNDGKQKQIAMGNITGNSNYRPSQKYKMQALTKNDNFEISEFNNLMSYWDSVLSNMLEADHKHQYYASDITAFGINYNMLNRLTNKINSANVANTGKELSKIEDFIRLKKDTNGSLGYYGYNNIFDMIDSTPQS